MRGNGEPISAAGKNEEKKREAATRSKKEMRQKGNLKKEICSRVSGFYS
jgi:hypothetical protein